MLSTWYTLEALLNQVLSSASSAPTTDQRAGAMAFVTTARLLHSVQTQQALSLTALSTATSCPLVKCNH